MDVTCFTVADQLFLRLGDSIAVKLVTQLKSVALYVIIEIFLLKHALLASLLINYTININFAHENLINFLG
jgi:hypothetical protein